MTPEEDDHRHEGQGHGHDPKDHDHQAHDHDHGDHDHHDHGDHDRDDHDDDDHGHAHGHDHHHGHGHHGHHHHHGPADFGDKRYLIGIVLNLAVVLAQVAGGLIGHSTALLADASHNMSDVLSLALAGGAAWLAAKPPEPRRTYGFRKATVFAALINGLLLVFTSGVIVWEAIHRFVAPAPVDGRLVMATAGVGVLVNGLTALMFMRGREGDANVRAAFIHMAGDALISVGVIVAGLLVTLTKLSWIDPLASIFIVLIILWGTVGLLREAIDMALDAAPRSVDMVKLRTFLCAQPGVIEVHDLHVWSMDASSSAMTAHLVMPEVADNDAFLQGLCGRINHKFGVEHATFQIERQHFDCHPPDHP